MNMEVIFKSGIVLIDWMETKQKFILRLIFATSCLLNYGHLFFFIFLPMEQDFIMH